VVTLEIDGKSYTAEQGQMLIEVSDAAGIAIPRFCYHKKLSVAANCRMCLVDVEKAPKPMPACATPVMDGMIVHTRSPKALAAQHAVMEFLLINHPLDCPICDQGGECELQDVALGYGNDSSQYKEQKRVVSDPDLGPLIATEMTRCIHCTRCVRFGEEIAGIREMGATGRGEHTRIGTYIAKTVDFELSGNVIDLCPVGALTSKPFRFHARAWEMNQHDAIAPHDAIGSNVCVHTRRGEVMRVAPRENEAVNEVWISDRDRFSYQGLYAEDRLAAPMIKENGIWRTVDWETALTFTASGLKKALEAKGASELGALASPTATLEELYLLQKLLRGLGCNNLDYRLAQCDFSDQDKAPLFSYFGQTIADFEQLDTALVIGSNLRKEQPLLNHRLRKAALNKQAQIAYLNPLDCEPNFPVAANLVVSPSAMTENLAGIAKALMLESNASVPEGMADIFAHAESTERHKKIATQLLKGEKKSVLLGRLACTSPNAAILRALAACIANLSGATLGYVDGAANSAGASLVGMLPHRGINGTVLDNSGKNAYDMLTDSLSAYILLNLEPELDSCVGETALNTLNHADFVVTLSAYHTPVQDNYADVILPIALFAETSGTYVNGEGRWQSFNGAVKAFGQARPAWKILRVLGNLLDQDGFDYLDSEQIRAEINEQLNTDQTCDTLSAWQAPTSLPQVGAGLERIVEMPMYSVDALVRRATALQKTADQKHVDAVHVSAELAAKVGELATLRHNGSDITLPVSSDARVPEQCALIYVGQPSHIRLGTWNGPLELTSA
jgi:NADH-quinone oxidoreductase subunit G